MPDPQDVTPWIEEYLDGKLGEAETRRLLALLEESDALQEQMGRSALLDRLLRASSLPPVSGKQVVQALRASELAHATTPRRRASVFGLGVALGILATMGGGGLLWWWNTVPSRPARAVGLAIAVPPSPAMDQGQPATNKFDIKPTPIPPAAAVGEVLSSRAEEVFQAKAIAAEELPDSAFRDESPVPPGDGSQEPGFVPPRTGESRLPQAETGRGTRVRPQQALIPTGSRESPHPPLVFVRLKLEGTANRADAPDDLALLLGELRSRLGLSYREEARSPDEVATDPDKNPVLYVSGHYRFSFTPAQRKTFRRFMMAGGTMVFDTGAGSKPFYDSARHELGIMFRDIPLKRLDPSHPINWACYELADEIPGGRPMLEGVTVRCRTVAVVSRAGMVAGAPSEEALRTAINLAAYVMAWRSWVKPGPLSSPMGREPDRDLADRLRGGQVVYAGDWRPRPAALSMLLDTFHQRTSVPVQMAVREVRLTDPSLFNLPFLYMAGHEEFQLTEAERMALRRYLENGGFLFAEACCGRRQFDQAFRAEMRRVLPEAVLTPVSPASSLYVEPNPVKRIGVTPLLAGQLGRLMIEPRLEGVELQNHYAVVYSPYGMAGGWEMSQNPYALGYTDGESIRLGQNILMYAVTH